MIKKQYPANKPELKKKSEIVGLFGSSNFSAGYDFQGQYMYKPI